MKSRRSILGGVDPARKDTVYLKRLAVIEAALTDRSKRAFEFTERDRNFIKAVRRKHNSSKTLTPEDREKIKRLHEAVTR